MPRSKMPPLPPFMTAGQIPIPRDVYNMLWYLNISIMDLNDNLGAHKGLVKSVTSVSLNLDDITGEITNLRGNIHDMDKNISRVADNMRSIKELQEEVQGLSNRLEDLKDLGTKLEKLGEVLG